MSLTLRADRTAGVTSQALLNSTRTEAESGRPNFDRTALAAAAQDLGDRGQLRFPNGRVLTGVDLRRIGMAPEGERETMLRGLTGDPGLSLRDFTLFCDDLAKTARGREVRGKEVVVPEAVASSMRAGTYGTAGHDRFTLETRAPTAPDAAPTRAPAPAPMAPEPSGVSARAPAPPAPARPATPSPSQTMAGRFDRVMRELPAEPVSGLVFRTVDVNATGFSHGRYGSLVNDSTAQQALGHMTPAQVRSGMADAVARHYPSMSADDRATLTDWLMERMDFTHEWSAAFRMRDHAVGMMNDAAREFTSLAGDTGRLQHIGEVLERLEHGNAEQREAAHNIRAGFDWDGVSTTDTDTMGARLRERAGILSREGRELGSMGPNRIMETLSGLPGAESAFRTAGGADANSYSSSRVTSMMEHGGSDATVSRWLPVGTALVAGVGVGIITGGAGTPAVVGLLAGMGSAAITGLPATMHAWEDVENAMARESSGAGAAGDIHAAETNRTVATGAYAASILIPGPLASKLGHAVHALHGAAAHIAVHATTHTAIEVADRLVHAHGHGDLGINTVQYARLQAGLSILERLPAERREAFETSFANAFTAAGVPDDAETRAGLMFMFLAAKGDTVHQMSPESASRALTSWLERNRATGGA